VLKSASIAVRVAVTSRLALPGTLPTIALTSERSPVRIASRSTVLGAPRRKGECGAGRDARLTKGTKRDLHASYGCCNPLASSINAETCLSVNKQPALVAYAASNAR
jgi:hypothetical protein